MCGYALQATSTVSRLQRHPADGRLNVPSSTNGKVMFHTGAEWPLATANRNETRARSWISQIHVNLRAVVLDR